MSILKAGMIASIPAICGFLGGVLGGVISDYLMRKTGSLNIARKTPIVIGMLLSISMVMCNYTETEWVVVLFMALAFFGKGIGALGWAVMADTAPKEISGRAAACSICSVTSLASSRRLPLVTSSPPAVRLKGR